MNPTPEQNKNKDGVNARGSSSQAERLIRRRSELVKKAEILLSGCADPIKGLSSKAYRNIKTRIELINRKIANMENKAA